MPSIDSPDARRAQQAASPPSDAGRKPFESLESLESPESPGQPESPGKSGQSEPWTTRATSEELLAREEQASTRLTRSASSGGPRALLLWLLSLPLFYKVLIANSTIVLIGAVAGTAITARIASANGSERGAFGLPLAIGFAVAGLALTFTLNALVLRAALSPLDRLRAVVERVQRGDVTVRAQPSPLDDAQLRRLAETLNKMLDEVERYEEQVRALSGRLIYAHEDERQRIARELHDDTGQVLTLLLIRLKLLEAQPGAEAIAPQLVELRGIVTSAIDQVRRLALNLRPPTIDQLGLFPSLRSLVTTFSESTGIETTLRLPRAKITLAPERTLAVYRVVQEALTNAAKHAKARRVTITVTSDHDDLRVVVTDDGHGFAPEPLLNGVGQQRDGAGVGLFGMEERARLAGGALTVRSAPGKGATVSLCVPLEHAALLKDSSPTESLTSPEDTRG